MREAIVHHHAENSAPGLAESFPTDPTGLPEATRPALLALDDGAVVDLRVGAVAKRLRDTTVRMLAYNGSIPGPTLKVRQHSQIVVNLTNDGDLETTLHRTEGADAGTIDWRFRVGDRVKIRLVNEMDSDHPMHHPFHLHGAGRFLVLARDGVVESNLVWKDTVLVRTGQTVDILFDVTNPGRWMAHCHIAEHMQSGMMFSFTVTPENGAA